ncbi:glycoside hydrolase [Maritimibacter sp. 55A14]|uniref:WD40/YVTN/BNR-like repeat-containing protein n=1 Tax=Maritimibacter sp. 55A14 TaxID=2174844 RepID=UPI000D61E9E1|nr:sialidase family protein [Maritimibacter sp. 55A14]PWE29266.1 glycoside hydrolase [Maritimibacter sp. 55A14]
MNETFTVLVGTTKGAFLLEGTPARDGWSISGPHCDGWPVNHVKADPITGHIWAGGGNEFLGAGVWRSTDGGMTWELSKLSKGQIDEWAAADPETARLLNWTPVETAFDGEVSAIWSLLPAHGMLYAGGKPGMLFASADGGRTWEKVTALSDHPEKESWNPGAAGLVVHSLLCDPAAPGKLWAGISAAGVFATEDGGATWERRNRLSNAEACAHHDHPAAPRDGETGHCVHNMVRVADRDLLYQQNHHGVFRSPDGGRTWQDITAGLPSTFGFPIAVHPRDAQTIWVLPLNSDTGGRFPPDASAAVWKSGDGGQSWQAKRDGLPARDCFFTVLRQSMATDGADPAGVYFGTNTGSVFASADEGESWAEIARNLPTILSVEVMQR